MKNNENQSENYDMLEFVDGKLRENPERFFTKKELIIAYYEEKGNTELYDTLYHRVDYAYKQIRKQLKKQKSALDTKGKKGGEVYFRYPQSHTNPMEELLRKNRRLRTEALKRLLKRSIGLLSDSWLASVVGEEIGKKEQVIIDFGQNLSVRQLSLVPTFFTAIEEKRVLRFSYLTKRNEVVGPMLFHPYYLKVYNGRWFVFGHATDLDGKGMPYTLCTLDRVADKVTEEEGAAYHDKANNLSAEEYFHDIVGVRRTREKGHVLAVEHIVLACCDEETYYRIASKPLHLSQKEVEKPEEGTHGKFSLDVIPNPELDTLLMSFGPLVEILEPQSYRDHFAARCMALAELYRKGE